MPLDHLLDRSRPSSTTADAKRAGLIGYASTPSGHPDHLANLTRARSVEVSETEALQMGFAAADAQHLAHTGLPAWPAPDLWFHQPVVLAEGVIRLGEDRDEREIFYNPGNSAVYCQRDISSNAAPRLVCAGLAALHAILAAYGVLIEQSVNARGRRVITENNLPDPLIDAFEQTIARIDGSAVSVGSFWRREIERLRSHLPE